MYLNRNTVRFLLAITVAIIESISLKYAYDSYIMYAYYYYTMNYY